MCILHIPDPASRHLTKFLTFDPTHVTWHDCAVLPRSQMRAYPTCVQWSWHSMSRLHALLNVRAHRLDY